MLPRPEETSNTLGRPLLPHPPPRPAKAHALVSLRGVSKRYGDLLANDAIDLSLAPGEIHALLGENGAGKSTLVKILYGVIEPSAGEILWEGRPVTIASPVEARKLGIGMVFQHFSLFEEMTVAENVAVALPERPFEAVRKELAEVSTGWGLALEPDRAVWTLSAGERQRIEIVRCLLQKPRLVVLDEPTSVLTPQESERLFETLTRLSAEGTAILYISHKLEEVRRICRAATILRGGKVVATLDPRERSAREIAALMVGSEVGEVRAHLAEGTGEEALRVENLSLPPEALHGKALVDVALTVRAGEVVGIAGVAGNGQSELFAAISGERLAPNAGDVVVAGTGAGRLGIRRAPAARRRLRARGAGSARRRAGPRPRRGTPVLSHHSTSGAVKAGFRSRSTAAARPRPSVISHFDGARARRATPRAQALRAETCRGSSVGARSCAAPKLLVRRQPPGTSTRGTRLIARRS